MYKKYINVIQSSNINPNNYYAISDSTKKKFRANYNIKSISKEAQEKCKKASAEVRKESSKNCEKDTAKLTEKHVIVCGKAESVQCIFF